MLTPRRHHHKQSWIFVILCFSTLPLASSQALYDSGRKAVIHEVASAKANNQLGLSNMMSREKCCTIAMFLGTMDMPAGKETEALAADALSCCRQTICSKFYSPQDCVWVSSGDDTWKADISRDLDRIEDIEARLRQLNTDDLNDPDAKEEKDRLTREKNMIDRKEMEQLKKVAPLTEICDKTLADMGIPEGSSQELQDARVDCVTLFVSIAAGACQWEPPQQSCVSVAVPMRSSASTMWPTLIVVMAIGAILGVTYYVAKPAAMADQVDRGEYSSLEELPPELK